MKTLLIFPPVSDPAHPPLGIASLSSFLKAKNEEVKLLDLNILSYYYLLSKDNLKQCGEKIGKRLKDLEILDELSLEKAKEYSFVAECFLAKEYLTSTIEEALTDLRKQSTYSSRAKYYNASMIVKRAMELVSAAHYPTLWNPRTFSMRYSHTRSRDVLKAISDRHENIFIPFYEHYLPEIVRTCPNLIGISINYYCQLIPGMTLAAILKKALKNIPVVVGGGLMCFFERRWESFSPFNNIVYGFIPYEGEEPILNLINAIKRGDSLSKVHSLVCFEKQSVKYNSLPHSNTVSFPPPDFDDLPLDKYLAPKIILPYATSRGCYWGHCAFCSQHLLYRHRFNQKSAQQVVEDLGRLSRRYMATDFYFVDEAISPSNAHKLSCIITQNNLPYNWFGEMRFEPDLDIKVLTDLSEGGCRMLLFGLESSVKRILELMGKGTDPNIISNILKYCKEIGIKTFIMFIVGFPTENRKEVEHTVKFIEAHSDYITHIGFGNFVLIKESPVYRNPHKYGISKVKIFSDEDLTIYADYEVTTGMSKKAAIIALNDIKKNPVVQSLTDLSLISRSHLFFLPHKEGNSKKKKIPRKKFNLNTPEIFYPKVAQGLVPVTMNFNLEKTRTYVREFSNGSPSPIKQCTTNYIYNPQTEILIEVSEHGLLLLKPCSGKYNLNDILLPLDEQNKKTALEFYQQLYHLGFLCNNDVSVQEKNVSSTKSPIAHSLNYDLFSYFN